MSNVFKLRQFWSDLAKNKRSLPLVKPQEVSEVCCSAKFGSFPINGFDEGIESVGNLQINLEVCFK